MGNHSKPFTFFRSRRVFKVFLLRCKGFYLFLLKVGVIVHCHRQYHAGWALPRRTAIS